MSNDQELSDRPISAGDKNQHITCTSTPLESTPGSQREAINKATLDTLYEELFGHPASSDSAVRIIQHEQVIARHKRLQKLDSSNSSA